MTNKPWAFRFPDDVKAQIESLMAETGKDKTTVVVDLLRKALSNDCYTEKETVIQDKPKILEQEAKDFQPDIERLEGMIHQLREEMLGELRA